MDSNPDLPSFFFWSSSLALASLDQACRDHRLDFAATLTTMAFDHSRSGWLGIGDLIAEPEGPLSSPVQLRVALWTGDTRDTRPHADMGLKLDNHSGSRA